MLLTSDLTSDPNGYPGFTPAFGTAWSINNGMPLDTEAGPPAGTVAPGDPANAADQSPPSACDISFNYTAASGLKWIVCGLVTILMNGVSLLEDFLVSQLDTDTGPLGAATPYHAVWGSFRTLALAIIVVVALVMVVFEATGVEAFSAYTMRTLFTRFGVAVLFIVLSWSILGAAVDAVKQWKYKPYLLNGEPVEIQTQVTMNFKLPN